MRTSILSISTLLALPLTVLADFHYGFVDYTITTATGRYAMILPASQTNCTNAYDFYPKGPFGFTVPTGVVQADICGKEVKLNVTSGSWYTISRHILEGNCTAVNATSPKSGVKSPVCSIGNLSGATYTDIWKCAGGCLQGGVVESRECVIEENLEGEIPEEYHLAGGGCCRWSQRLIIVGVEGRWGNY